MKLYSLISTRDFELRYIGRTKQSLSARLSGHLSRAKNGAKDDKSLWIAEELEQGFEVKMVLLAEDASESDEKNLIMIFGRIKKDRLMNAAHNGEWHGPRAEKWAKRREADTKKYEALRERLKSFKGQKTSYI